MAYKLILQEICPECDGAKCIKRNYEEYDSSISTSYVTCYTCSGKGYIYQEEHLVPELKERIILNFEKES